MKAAWFQSFGELKVKDIEMPKISSGYALLRLIEATLNPIDIFTIMGKREVKPIPHIPGAEVFGEVVEGKYKGQKVIVYPRLFCGMCEYCVSQREMICSGELFGVSTNGGFSEFFLAPEENLFPVPSDISSEILSSLPIGALTSYHALKDAEIGQKVAVFGATGNTGMFAVQIAKLKGCEVYAVSRKKADWLKDFGADEIIPYDSSEKFKEYFDLVIDPLGEKTFDKSIRTVKKGGKFITFGILTGRDVKLDILHIYSKEITIKGVTGGTRKELMELISFAKKLKVRVWKKVKIDELPKAIAEMDKKEGKIGIVPS